MFDHSHEKRHLQGQEAKEERDENPTKSSGAGLQLGLAPVTKAWPRPHLFGLRSKLQHLACVDSRSDLRHRTWKKEGKLWIRSFPLSSISVYWIGLYPSCYGASCAGLWGGQKWSKDRKRHGGCLWKAISTERRQWLQDLSLAMMEIGSGGRKPRWDVWQINEHPVPDSDSKVRA